MNSNKAALTNGFKRCLDILRQEGLTGEKALTNLTLLLILKLLEPKLEGVIGIDNYKYDFESHFEDEVLEVNKKKLLSVVRFSNLVKEEDDNIQNIIKYLWDIILSEHPITKNIFLKNNMFDIQNKSTYKKLFNIINSIEFDKTEYDVLGDAYEEVIQRMSTGKELGQFFTPPSVKKMMVKLIDPKVYPDGKIETCCDPSMGTGGLLISYLKAIMEKSKEKNINLDWDFIKDGNLHGKEIKAEIYPLSVSNILISSGHMFNKLERGDSIREQINGKFDNIIANPPFGIDGLNYEEFNASLKDEYIPIPSDNSVSLFIQAIICMLNKDGKCAVVIPNGSDLNSKSDKTLIRIREYLLKTCDLKEIIHLPRGIFTHTPIGSCVFYFIKKREVKDVLQTKETTLKNKKIKKEYVFSEDHETSTVSFYEFNPEKDSKELLAEVPVEEIINNSYSLNYNEYLNEEEEEYDGCKNMTLDELCNFLPKSKRPASYGNDTGLFPFFKSSKKAEISSYVDEPDYKEESLIIGDGGDANINYGIEFSASDHCYILQNKNKSDINLKYVYYYIKHNLDIMRPLYTGAGLKNIAKEKLKNVKVPIPSIKRQNEIVKEVDDKIAYKKRLERAIKKAEKEEQKIIIGIKKPKSNLNFIIEDEDIPI
jgi:type I restriction-modification system DNA methylase subunit